MAKEKSDMCTLKELQTIDQNFSGGKDGLQGDFMKDIMDKTISEVVFEYLVHLI